MAAAQRIVLGSRVMWRVIKLDGWVFVVDGRESVWLDDPVVVDWSVWSIDGRPVVGIVDVVVMDRSVVLVHGGEIFKAPHVIGACLSLVPLVRRRRITRSEWRMIMRRRVNAILSKCHRDRHRT